MTHTSGVEYDEYIKKLGKKIKDIRVSKEITQEGMEEDNSGISYRTVQDIENGQSNPSVKSIFKIARRLDIELSDLMSLNKFKFKRRQKVSEKEIKLLYSYFKKATLIKNRLDEIKAMKTFDKEELKLYQNIWLNFLYLVIEYAIFRLEIKEKPFSELYDFKLNSWKNDNVLRFIDSHMATNSIQEFSSSKSAEIELTLKYADYIHSLIKAFFQKKII